MTFTVLLVSDVGKTNLPYGITEVLLAFACNYPITFRHPSIPTEVETSNPRHT